MELLSYKSINCFSLSLFCFKHCFYTISNKILNSILNPCHRLNHATVTNKQYDTNKGIYTRKIYLMLIACTLSEIKVRKGYRYLNLTFRLNLVIVYTRRMDSANSDTTHANDNVTTFQEVPRRVGKGTAKWIRLLGGGGGIASFCGAYT